jgi:ABC-2 type transport system ATP-binding protein
VCGHEVDGRSVRLRTRELQRAAAGLLAWAAEAGVELRRLDVRSASLEEAFLEIARGAADGGTRDASGSSEAMSDSFAADQERVA